MGKLYQKQTTQKRCNAYLDDRSLITDTAGALQQAEDATREFDQLTDQERNLTKQALWTTSDTLAATLRAARPGQKVVRDPVTLGVTQATRPTTGPA